MRECKPGYFDVATIYRCPLNESATDNHQVTAKRDVLCSKDYNQLWPQDDSISKDRCKHPENRAEFCLRRKEINCFHLVLFN